jgi:hypothetical protein
MMRLAWIAMVFIGSVAFSQVADDEAERQIVLSACTGCHSLDYYVTPRSRKAWELTVANMRVYTQNAAITFTEEQADRVVAYLATYFHEDSSLDAAKHFSQAVVTEPAPINAVQPIPEPPVAPVQVQPVSNVVATPPPVQVVAAPGPRVLPDAIRERLAHPRWKPSHMMKHLAEYSGYLAVACTLVMFISGHNRRRLARRFRPIHIFSALGLFLGLATHAIIYLIQYGNPPVLWYWFGIASFLLLVLAQLQGIIRKRFGRIFLNIHVTAGYCGLTLAILHWIWAWL